MRAPWVRECVFGHFGEETTYIIPNREWVVVGGTGQVGDWRTSIDMGDAEAIMRRACQARRAARRKRSLSLARPLLRARGCVRAQGTVARRAPAGALGRAGLTARQTASMLCVPPPPRSCCPAWRMRSCLAIGWALDPDGERARAGA